MNEFHCMEAKCNLKPPSAKIPNSVFIAFEVKKRASFTPYKTGLANFESSWLTTFALLKLEVFDIV
jgi:hypothetical protein